MHGPSLLISKSSVKVVRHKIHILRCGKQEGSYRAGNLNGALNRVCTDQR